MHSLRELRSFQNVYNLTEVQSKYGISETALQNLIKRYEIPKLKKGWYSYVPKTFIDKLLKNKHYDL